MTNKERQKKLDEIKWLDSESCGYDRSGRQAYCHYCDYQTEFLCKASQEEREKNCLCAKAYNKLSKTVDKRKNKC